jgi:transposase-like protein
LKRTGINHRANFKAQVAVATLEGDKILAESAKRFSVHPIQITEWKQQLLARAADVFGEPKTPLDSPDLKAPHATIRQLTLKNDFKGSSSRLSVHEPAVHRALERPRAQINMDEDGADNVYFNNQPARPIAA